MAKKELPENEDVFTIDTPDVEGAEGGWDEWDDFDESEEGTDTEAAERVDEAEDVDVDVAPADAEADEAADVDLVAETDVDVAEPNASEAADAAADEGAVPTMDADWGDDEWDEGEAADEFAEDAVEPEETAESEDVDVPEAVDGELPAEEAQAETAVEENVADVEGQVESPVEDEMPSDEVAQVETVEEAIAENNEQAAAEAQAEVELLTAEEEPVAEQVEEAAEPAETSESSAEEQTAEAGAEAEEASAETGESVSAEDIPDPEDADAAKTEEELQREQEELEAYRSAMGESTAEMADVSEYRNFRKKTKTENTSAKPKKSDFDLFANRYKVKTMNAMVAASDPIVYFYNACLFNNGNILAFNVYQVLQDRFLGKMVPQLFTAVAENSAKIEELNEANLMEQIKVCAEFPQYEFIISISARFFTKPALLERLLKVLPEEGVPNMVLAFDCSSLENIAIAAKAGLSSIRQRGVKVLLDNTERVTMTVLSEFDYDFIRIDSRYYEMGNPRAEAYLRLLLNLTKEQGVKTIATFCDSEDLSEYMYFMGVDAVQGNAVSRPMRTVPNAVKAITLLPSMLDS